VPIIGPSGYWRSRRPRPKVWATSATDGVGVVVGVLVAVGVAVLVGVWVGVGVAVLVGVAVRVGVGEGPIVGVGVKVGGTFGSRREAMTLFITSSTGCCKRAAMASWRFMLSI
jgi:hypothetical protein